MRIVIDTNVLLQSIGINNPYRLIWDFYLEEKYELAVSVDILFEYLEKFEQLTSINAATSTTSIIIASYSTVIIRRWIRWNLISVDYDDNKFFDIAIASNSDYLVTNDAHFNVAKRSDFPKVHIISASQFLTILKSL